MRFRFLANLTTTNKFKNDSGQRYIRRLFLEGSYSANDKSTILYTLQDQDYEGYPSLKRLYIQEEDTTEVTFANKYFDGFEHWQMICETTWFKPFIEAWRKELDLILQEKALQNIRFIASNPNHKQYLEANKLLLGTPWRSKTEKSSKSKRGRPSNDEIAGNLKETAAEEKAIKEDLRRITEYEEV